MTDTIVLTLVAATLAQALFCISVLALKAFTSRKHLLLAALFATFCSASGGAVIETFAPEMLTRFYILTLPAYLLMGPLLWFYISWLTAERPWQMRRGHWLQFAPALIAFLAILIEFQIWITPAGEWDPDQTASASVAVQLLLGVLGLTHFALFLFWPLQSVYYLVRIIRRLIIYRASLKEHFANYEGRQLGWLFGFLIVFAVVWVVGLITVITQNVGEVHIMPREIGAALFLVLVWSLGLLGLSQRPGFEGDYVDDDEPPEDSPPDDEPSSEKYQRSALSEEQALRIASKIRLAMERDQLFLDPNLSLNKLARHITVSPNHISQTLNETMGDCFFDYVNGWRIRHAEPMIISSDKTVLDIALETGFNARSSFYKAFKRETGKTPGEYRKTNPKKAS